MTVRITNLPYGTYSVGQTVTLDRETEAALIRGNRAVSDTSSGYPAANTNTKPASYYGVYAGTDDMTTELTLALNAALSDGYEVILPPGNINISGTIRISAAQAQNVSTYAGTVNWAKPVGIRGYGPLATRIVQNTPNITSLYYFPSSGNLAHARFADFMLTNATPSYTNVNNAGIQLGGGTVGCVGEQFLFSNVWGDGLYAVTRLDDVTGVVFTGSCQGGRYKYYNESGYNADQHTFRSFYHSFDHPINVAYTSVSTNTLNGISSAITPFVYVGMTATGPNIPADTTVTAVGSTTVTLSNAPSAGASTVDFHLGTLCSLLATNVAGLYSGSGFATVANAGNYFNRNRSSNPNLIIFDDVLFNRGEGLIEDYGGSYILSTRGVYMERPKKIATFANAGLQGVDLSDIFLSQPQTMRQPMITITSAVPQGRISNIRTDGSPNTTTAVSAPNITSNSEFGPLVIENVAGSNVITGAGPTISAGARKIVLGAKENGTGTLTYDTASGALNFDALGVDIVEVTINTTGQPINGPNSVQVPKGRKIRFDMTCNSAGATVIFGTKYKLAGGGNVGTVTGGAVGTSASIEFVSLGNGNCQTQLAAVPTFV